MVAWVRRWSRISVSRGPVCKMICMGINAYYFNKTNVTPSTLMLQVVLALEESHWARHRDEIRARVRSVSHNLTSATMMLTSGSQHRMQLPPLNAYLLWLDEILECLMFLRQIFQHVA